MCIFMVTPGVTLMCTLLAKIDLVLIAASGFSALVCKLSQQIVNENGNALIDDFALKCFHCNACGDAPINLPNRQI